MKKRGVSRCAALLLVLLMMMSTAVMLPSQDATAQNHEIWGFVMTPDFKPLDGALVNLADVHGLDPTQLTENGEYGFLVAPGFYEIEISMDGYFSQSYGPFRFDGESNLQIADFILEETPSLDWVFSGTVLSTSTTHVNLELIDFTTQTITKENVTGSLDGNMVNLGSHPIVYGSYTGYWNHASNGTDNMMVEGTDFTVDLQGLWTGNITITNWWIASELGNGTGWIEFTYDSADSISYLENAFIAPGYQAFKNNTIPFPSPSGFTLDVDTKAIEVVSDFIFGLDTLEITYDYHSPITGATLTIYNATKDHVVSTDSFDGDFSLLSWAGDFEVRAKAVGYQPKVMSILVTGDQSMWILLDGAILINGRVTDDSTSSPVGNVRAYMFCTSGVPSSIRLLEAGVAGSYYWFDAYPGSFNLIVDADGYEAQSLPILVTNDAVFNFSLSLSEEELVDTSIGFVADDWNNITIYKNLTLNKDSHLPSLGTASLGSLELEIDLTVGDGNGILLQTEKDAFVTWLVERGPQFLTTTGLFTTEAIDYTLELLGMASRYTVAVTYDAQNIWIETVAWYTTSGIALDENTYNLELKTAYDQTILIEGEDRILTNFTYNIALPYGYELIWNSSMNTDVIGFTDIFVDPKKGVGTGTVVMTVGKSDVGVAMAKITGPEECDVVNYQELCVTVLNRDFEDYLAVIPAEAEIQFSAEDSTDPNSQQPGGKISQYASFTWDFDDGTPLQYGITPIHNYSDPGTGPGNYTVSLSIIEPGGNLTSREINVSVDGKVPQALVWYNSDDFHVENSQLHIDEDITLHMGANLSRDEVWTGEDGELRTWEWDFDSDGIPDAFTEMVDTEFYTEPGKYTLNLTVWDWVGHKSDNYSKTIYVDDVTPPEVSLTILNSTYVETNFPLEQETVYFNASDSEDNFSSQENLTYSWTIDGTTKNGDNVSYVFSEPGDYSVNLTVSDEAGVKGYHNITVVISPDQKLHSHIYMVRESFEYTPGSPEVGQSIKIKVVVANTDAGVDAANVSVRFWIVEETDKEISGTVKYYDYNGTQIFTSTIPAGGNLTAEISWTPGSHGDYTIKVNCTASNEPTTEEGDNSIQGTISVIEAQWVTTMIIVVFVVLIFVIAIILLFRRKFAGKFPKLLSREKKPEKSKKKKKVKK